MSITSAKSKLVEKIESVADSSTNLEQLAYAGASLAKLNDMKIDVELDDDVYKIGIPGTFGFGVAAIPDELLPAGYIKLSGHTDTASANYGRVMDEHGSVFNYRPVFYYKIVGNVVSVSDKQLSGYVKLKAFEYEPNGYLQFAYLAGNSGGKLVSKAMLDPVSTSSSHNPIGDLVSNPANNYAGFVDACKGMGYTAMTIFQWQVLQLIALAQSQSGASNAAVAYNDVLPHFPKGNLANSLADNNDASVIFTPSGYSNCALTGSASNVAKTTDNGQDCGTADVNGNMWKIAIGLTYLAKVTGTATANGETSVTIASHGLAVDDVIYFGGTPSSGSTYNTGAFTVTAVSDGNTVTLDPALTRDIASTDGVYSSRYFRILKPSIHPSTLTAANLLDASNYDLLDLTGVVNNNGGWTFFGDGDNQVLNFSTTPNSKEFLQASVCIPTQDGTNSSENTDWGNGAVYRYLRHGCVPIVGVSWGNSSPIGLFSLNLNYCASTSSNNVGGFASVSLK